MLPIPIGLPADLFRLWLINQNFTCIPASVALVLGPAQAEASFLFVTPRRQGPVNGLYYPSPLISFSPIIPAQAGIPAMARLFSSSFLAEPSAETRNPENGLPAYRQRADPWFRASPKGLTSASNNTTKEQGSCDSESRSGLAGSRRSRLLLSLHAG